MPNNGVISKGGINMRNRTNLLVGVAGIAAFLAAAPGFAQTPQPAADAVEPGDIVVTANKREQNLNDVGLTITAIGAEALKERKITSLEDIASIVPGLVYTPSTTNTPIFTLRGVGFNESSLGVYPAVSVYMDQVPLSFPVLASHSAYDLERVEVLKGPQGTLFGQNSTGGAINYVAAKPTDTLTAGGDIGYGRFSQIDGNAFISGPLGEKAGFRLAVNGLHSSDWQKSYTRNDTNGHQNYLAGRLTFEVKPSDSIQLNFGVNAWRDKSQPQAGQLIAVHEQVTTATAPIDRDRAAQFDAVRNYLSPPLVAGAASQQLSYPFSPFNARAADWSATQLDPETGVQVKTPPFGGLGAVVIGTAKTSNFDPFSDRKFLQGAFRGDFEFGGVTLTSMTSYVDYKQKQRTDGDGAAFVGFDLQSGAGTIKTFNQELRLANDAASEFRWVVGGNYENSKTFEDQLLRYFANSNHFANTFYINSSGDRLSQKIKNYALFGNVEYDLGDKLTFKAGARYTSSKIDAINAAYNLTNGNVDKYFNFLGSLGGQPFTPIGPNDSYTLNATVNPALVPNDLTIHSPQSSAGLGIPGIPFNATLKQNNVSWRVGLDYKATDDVLIYANVSRGYKAGSFPVLAAAAYVSVLPVVQESVTAFESGFKATLADGKVQFNGAAFYYDYKDKQVRGKLLDAIFGTLDVLTNVPKSRIFGVEADVTVRPTPGLTASVSTTYLSSKIKKFTGFDIFGGISNVGALFGKPENLAGNVLPYTPKISASGNLDYRFNPGGATPFAGVTVSYKSGQDAAIGGGNTTLPTGPRYRLAAGIGQFPYRIDSYATVDARLGYEAEDGAWRVMVWGKNITNKYYITAVLPSSDSTSRFAGKPATYGVTLGFKLGLDAKSAPTAAAPMAAPEPVAQAVAPAPVAVAEAPSPVAAPAAPGPFIIFFDWNKSSLTPEASAILKAAAQAYKDTGQAHVSLSGFADKSGTDAYNDGLSARRAATAKDYMVSLGVPVDVIATTSFGEGKPLVETADGVREPQNRRVEITF
jgi:iron complex outermembrane recepter protein